MILSSTPDMKGQIRKNNQFVHPDGLYTDSNEKGYNGKDLIECVAIKEGMIAQKKDSSGHYPLYCWT